MLEFLSAERSASAAARSAVRCMLLLGGIRSHRGEQVDFFCSSECILKVIHQKDEGTAKRIALILLVELFADAIRLPRILDERHVLSEDCARLFRDLAVVVLFNENAVVDAQDKTGRRGIIKSER